MYFINIITQIEYGICRKKRSSFNQILAEYLINVTTKTECASAEKKQF